MNHQWPKPKVKDLVGSILLKFPSCLLVEVSLHGNVYGGQIEERREEERRGEKRRGEIGRKGSAREKGTRMSEEDRHKLPLL